MANCILAIMDDTWHLGCDLLKRDQGPIPFRNLTPSACSSPSAKIMKSNLVKSAAEVIPNPKILVNMVSQRVRQLCIGHRPMVEFIPGLGHADIALSEIAAGKLSFESTLNQNGTDAATQVVEFPGIRVAKAKKKAA